MQVHEMSAFSHTTFHLHGKTVTELRLTFCSRTLRLMKPDLLACVMARPAPELSRAPPKRSVRGSWASGNVQPRHRRVAGGLTESPGSMPGERRLRWLLRSMTRARRP